MKYRSDILLLAALGTTCLLGACDRQSPLPLTGTIERDRIELVAEAQEPITRIAVREGEPVKAGQLVLQLDPARYRDLEAAGVAACNQESARIAADQALLSEAQATYVRTEALVKTQVHSQADLDAAKAALEAARARLDGDRAALARAQAQLADTRLTLQRLTVQAPRAAVVDSLPYHAGERPPARAVVAVLLASDSAYAQIYVPEPLRAEMHPGLRASLRIDGVSRSYSGTLRFISAQAAFTPYYALDERDRSHLAYLAKVYFDSGDIAALPTGAPVVVDFPSLPH